MLGGGLSEMSDKRYRARTCIDGAGSVLREALCIFDKPALCLPCPADIPSRAINGAKHTPLSPVIDISIVLL